MTREALHVDTVIIPAVMDLAEAVAHENVRQQLDDAQAHRRALAEDLRQLAPTVPEAREGEAEKIYDLVTASEMMFISPDLKDADYAEGTAAMNDELVSFGEGLVLMEAQHATSPVRKASGKREAPDHGTAGLGAALASEGWARIIIPRGRQTGNANVDPKHPIKEELRDELSSHDDFRGFLSLHGCRPGKVTSLLDRSEIHAVVGLGFEPREASFAAAEELVAQAAAMYGLRVAVGNITPHLNFERNPEANGAFWDLSNRVVTDEGGRPKATRLAGLMPTSTVSFMTEETADRPGMPLMQLEISRSLRLMPLDAWRRPDRQAEKMGVYLGFCLSRLAAQISIDMGQSKA